MNRRKSKPNTIIYSEEPSKIEDENEHQYADLRGIVEDQLELNIQKYSSEIKDELNYLLIDLLKYPSTLDAELHQHANRLGNFDIKVPHKSTALSARDKIHHEKEAHSFCKCCGLVIQHSNIAVCSSFQQFPRVGISTFLFFESVKNLAILMFVMGIIYSAFALYTNILISSSFITILNFSTAFSEATKLLNSAADPSIQITMMIESWLLVALVIIWWIILLIIKCFQIKYERLIDSETITAADFSIMIEDIPIKYTQDFIQKELNKYCETLSFHSNKQALNSTAEIQPFLIKKICKATPFYMIEKDILDAQLIGLDQDILQKRQLFAKWIEQFRHNKKFSIPRSERQKQYQKFQVMLQRRKKKAIEIENKAKKEYSQELKSDGKTTCFLTLAHSQSANMIEDNNPTSMAAKIRYLMSCCQSSTYFKIIDDITRKQVSVTVSRAPEPEDIIWNNIGVPLSTIICRKLITYSVTLCLIGASFGIVYGLTILQLLLNDVLVSILVSLVITLINLLIGIAIYKLTTYERNFTETHKQTSLAIKSIIAQLINFILVPVITNLYIKNNVFYTNGLVDDIFYLSLINAFLPPLLKFFDFPYFIAKLWICYKSRPYQKMLLKQSELNDVYELKQFEVGYEYIYFMSLYFFTCFYVTLQPIIVAFTLLGFILMYWAQKYSLLNRCKRPTPGSDFIAEAIGQLIALGPIVFSLGGLTWTHFFFLQFSSFTFIGHIVSLGLSFLFFILPFNSIFNACCHVPDDQILEYDECRILLPSEYDRLNPATAELGVDDFIKYTQLKKEQQLTNLSNVSQQNLFNKYDMANQIIGFTKMSSIFGKNTEISKKMKEDQHDSRLKIISQEEKLQVIPEPENTITEENFIVQEDFLTIHNQELSPNIIKNFSSNGEGYGRKKTRSENRKKVKTEGPQGYHYEEQKNSDQANIYSKVQF